MTKLEQKEIERKMVRFIRLAWLTVDDYKEIAQIIKQAEERFKSVILVDEIEQFIHELEEVDND